MHTHARLEEERQVKSCREISGDRFLHRKHQRLLPGDVPSPARMVWALQTQQQDQRPLTVPQLWAHQQPLLRVSDYAIVTHFLNDFALVILLQQLIGISNLQELAATTLAGPVWPGGTFSIEQGGSRVPMQRDPALLLPHAAPPWDLGGVPKGVSLSPEHRWLPGG